MRIFEWKNEELKHDLFLVLSASEREEYSLPESAAFPGADEYYYFLDLKPKALTPMSELSLAFGGQYNAHPPFGRELSRHECSDIGISDFKLVK